MFCFFPANFYVVQTHRQESPFSRFSSRFRSESKGKRDRDQNVVQSLGDRENLHKIFERNVDLAVRGEREWTSKNCMKLTQKLMQDIEKKRNSDAALHEINQEFESQRFQPQQASRWADQAQGDKISLYGELELRHRLFQENHARDFQEIEELRRICCEETERARQAIIVNCLCIKRGILRLTQLLTQIKELQNKVNSLSDAREFYDPESGSRSGATHVPSQPSTIPSPRTMPCRDSGSPHDTWNTMCVLQEVFLHEEDHPQLFSRIHGIWHPLLRNWDVVLQELQGEGERHQKKLNTSISSHHFQSRRGKLNHTGGT